MLITVSGMVGSGKSTVAGLVVDRLEAAGLQPEYVRFRYLKLLGFKRPSRARTSSATPDPLRGSGFALRRLTAPRATGYLVRVIAFRMSGVGAASACAVMDRYFYDNFVQYRLDSQRERLYVAVLRWIIPVPDLALLLIARDETISSRRPNYATEYVSEAGRRYRALSNLFPNLIVIRTDADIEETQDVRRLLDGLLRRS